jgi:uncharacterized membrane protein
MKSTWFWIGVLLTAGSFAGSFYVWTERAHLLPDQVPTHWNAAGEPDQFLARDDMFWILQIGPLVQLGFLALIPLLLWLSPRSFDFEGSTRIYYRVMTLALVLFSYLNGLLLVAYTHPEANTLSWLLGGLFGFFALLGNVLGQVPRNFWMGIRVPWTLASPLVWIKTHRLAAWLWVGGGLLGILLVIVGAPLYAFLSLLAVMVLLPIGYSLWLYKWLERHGKLDIP